MDREHLLKNIVSAAAMAKAFGLPIVHSWIVVSTGRGQPTVSELADVLQVDPPIDWMSTNACESGDFLAAVRTTGRRKLIMCARPVGGLAGHLVAVAVAVELRGDWAREDTVADHYGHGRLPRQLYRVILKHFGYI